MALSDGRRALVLSLSLAACGGDWESDAESVNPGTAGSSGTPADWCDRELPAATPAGHPTGLHAVGNRIEDSEGNTVVLRGVNRSGTEYKCVQGTGIFDGPSDEASVVAIASWNVNAVRVPLNESCWLSLNGLDAKFSGEAYRTAIRRYVDLLHKYALIPILELHWAAPAGHPAERLLPLPNLDHSIDFWQSVASTFLDDTGVILELYNEPFPDDNRDEDAGWECWRDGCTVPAARARNGDEIWPEYEAAGMQTLVDAIRETSSEHLILLGGLQFSNALSQWLDKQPDDPNQNLGAAWHVYNFNACSHRDCWNDAPARVAAEVPVVATEIGQDDCSDTVVRPLMDFLDGSAAGYLAWNWNLGPCVPASAPGRDNARAWGLVTNFQCPMPSSDYAAAVHDRLMSAR